MWWPRCCARAPGRRPEACAGCCAGGSANCARCFRTRGFACGPTPGSPRPSAWRFSTRPAGVYTRLYCGRGDMENRLKELQQGLAMDRTSCSRFAANQLRLLFSLAAYVLFQVLQGFARGAAVGPAQVWTLRERLLKVAVWTERSVRRIVLHFPQAFPWRDAWQQLAQALRAT